MLGQFYSKIGSRYNIIILAAGAGQRMGVYSDVLPKALSEIGNYRAIDLLINKYCLVAHKFIVGTGFHADLLESYLLGRYSELPLEFSREPVEEIKNNFASFLYCLDHTDSRYPTIVTFCDLIILSNNCLVEDSLFVVTKDTLGHTGTFRHSFSALENRFIVHPEPKDPSFLENGVLGTFVFSDTHLLKAQSYANWNTFTDFTEGPATFYTGNRPLTAIECKTVYEFGTLNDLCIVREMWKGTT